MYSVLLDNERFFTGSYAEDFEIEGWETVEELPNGDAVMQRCHKLEGGNWVFYASKKEEYDLLTQKEENQLEIERLKKLLAESDYMILKCCEAHLTSTPCTCDVSVLINERNTIRETINALESI